MADETLSNLTPVITVSGLPSGPGSFSGATQQPGASGISGYGQATPGIEGGPGLDLLSMLLQQAGSGAGDAGVGALTPFTAQSLGQQTGGLSAGSFGQGGGQGLIAGGMGTGAGAQQQTGAGSIDPLAMLQKILGLGSKAAGAAGSLLGTSSPTIGDTGGTSLSDQLRSQQQAAGGNATLNGITASPVLTQEGLQGQLGQLQPGQSLNPQQLEGLGQFDTLPSGTASPTTLSFLNQAQGGVGGIPQGTPQQEMIQSLLGAGFNSDQIQQVMSALGGAQGFSAGEIPTGGSIPSGLSGTPTASPTGGFSGTGAATSGLGAAANVISLIQALKSGNVPGEIGAGVNTAGSLASLSQTLGVAPEALSGALSTISPYLPLLGAALTGASINPGTPAGGEAAGTAAAEAAGGAAVGSIGGASGLLGAAGVAAAPFAAVAPVVLGIALAINQALNPKTNYAANKESGIVGPNLTSALNSAVQGVPQDLSGLSTPALESLIPQLGQGLQGLFSPAGAGAGTATSQTDISRYRAGLASADPAAAANIQAEQNQAQQGLLQDIGLLQQRGVGNDVIGGLLGGGDAEAARISQLNAGGGPTASGSFASLDPTLQQAFQSYYNTAGNPGAEATPFGTGSYGNNLLNPNFNANAFGGNTWYLLNKLGLDTPAMLQQYGIQAPGFNQPYLQGLMSPVLSNIAPVPAGQAAGYIDSSAGTA